MARQVTFVGGPLDKRCEVIPDRDSWGVCIRLADQYETGVSSTDVRNVPAFKVVTYRIVQWGSAYLGYIPERGLDPVRDKLLAAYRGDL